MIEMVPATATVELTLDVSYLAHVSDRRYRLAHHPARSPRHTTRSTKTRSRMLCGSACHAAVNEENLNTVTAKQLKAACLHRVKSKDMKLRMGSNKHAAPRKGLSTVSTPAE